MIFSACNVRHLYRAGSTVPVSKELSECKYDSLGVMSAGMVVAQN
jgi:hypothetical protein